MATKSLSIKEEAYRRLKSFKGDEDSFSDVIMKVTEDKKDFRKGFGAWEEREGVEEVISKGREKVEEDLKRDIE